MSDTTSAPQLIEDLSLVFTDSASSLPGWIPGASITLLVSLGVVGWLRQRHRAAQRAKQALISGFRDGPPDHWALRRLAALRENVDTLPPHGFALEVSEILRVFLERRFDLRAAHQSTEEFLLDVRGFDALSLAQQKGLQEFLCCCDEGKFARRVLAGERKRDLLTSAVRLVRETGRPLSAQDARDSRASARPAQERDQRERRTRASAA